VVSGVTAALSSLRIPFQALVVALAGTGVAWLFLNGHWVAAVLAALLTIALGTTLDAIGTRALPDHPVAAVHLLQGWLLIPLAIAVLAAAGVIVVTIELTLPEGTSTETEELVGAVSAGIISFLTAGFVSWAEDEKDSQLADHIQEAFSDHYVRPEKKKRGAHVFEAGSRGEKWVQSNEFEEIEGWGRKARLTRAHGIADELRGGGVTDTKE
jgi:hypothetical protein